MAAPTHGSLLGTIQARVFSHPHVIDDGRPVQLHTGTKHVCWLDIGLQDVVDGNGQYGEDT